MPYPISKKIKTSWKDNLQSGKLKFKDFHGSLPKDTSCPS